jgi:hypothetical protein
MSWGGFYFGRLYARNWFCRQPFRIASKLELNFSFSTRVVAQSKPAKGDDHAVSDSRVGRYPRGLWRRLRDLSSGPLSQQSYLTFAMKRFDVPSPAGVRRFIPFKERSSPTCVLGVAILPEENVS